MVIVVDTSVWVSHFRAKNEHLSQLLLEDVISIHPFVVGELACGRLHPRRDILHLLQALPEATLASHEEVLHFIEGHKLAGSGIGFVDAHLLVATKLMRGLLWTTDKPLRLAADKLDLAY